MECCHQLGMGNGHGGYYLRGYMACTCIHTASWDETFVYRNAPVLALMLYPRRQTYTRQVTTEYCRVFQSITTPQTPTELEFRANQRNILHFLALNTISPTSSLSLDCLHPPPGMTARIAHFCRGRGLENLPEAPGTSPTSFGLGY